jgi:uncharacterized membrane protein YecN with MAPEG domain
MFRPHELTALVTVAALLLYVALAVRVARMRLKAGVPPPAMTGDPAVERAVRVHGNTGEWLVAFLPGLWLFNLYWGDRLAAILGLVWIVCRILYAVGYWKAAERRLIGFVPSFLVVLVLLIGAAAGAIRVMMVTGGV